MSGLWTFYYLVSVRVSENVRRDVYIKFYVVVVLKLCSIIIIIIVTVLWIPSGKPTRSETIPISKIIIIYTVYYYYYTTYGRVFRRL